MKKIFYTIIVFILIVGVTGCGKDEGKITITCTSKEDKLGSMETQNVTTYHFDDNQYVTDYSIVTTQKFEDKSTYDEYKKAQEETLESSTEDVTYDLKADDKKMTLVFTMTIKKIDINNAETEEEKDSLKASSILDRNESVGSTCKVKGISKSKLK